MIVHIKVYIHVRHLKKRQLSFRTSIAHVNKNQFIYLFRLMSMNRIRCGTREGTTSVARSTLVFFPFFSGAFPAWEDLTVSVSSFYFRHILFDLYLIYAVLTRHAHATNNMVYLVECATITAIKYMC